MKLEEVIQESITLVTEGQTINAIKNMRSKVLDVGLQNDLNLLQSRYSCVDNQYKSGFLTTDEYFTNLTRLNSGLLLILNEKKLSLTKTPDQDQLTDRVRTAKEEHDYKVSLEKFMSSDDGIKKTMEIVNEFFATMTDKVENLSELTGLKMKYLTSPNYGLEGIINIEIKASIYLCWSYKSEYSLQGARLRFVLFDQISTFDYAVAVSLQPAKEIATIEFIPTADKRMEVKWNSNKVRFLDIEDVQMQCFELIAYYLDNNSN